MNVNQIYAQVTNPPPQYQGNVPLIYIEADMWNLVLWGFIAAAALLCIILVAWGVKRFLTPQESKNIYESSRKKNALILLLGLDHWGDIIPVRKFSPEGVVESKPEGRGALKTNSAFMLPQQTKIGKLNVAVGKDPEKTRLVAQWLANLNSEKIILRGARVPIVGAVADKAIAVGLKGFGALAFLEKLEKLFATVDSGKSDVNENETDPEKVKQAGMTVLDKLKAEPEFKDLAVILEDFKFGFSAIDLNAVRSQFPYFYDQTHRDSMKERNQIIGFRKAAKKNDKSDIKVLLILLVLVFGLLAAAALILKFL